MDSLRRPLLQAAKSSLFKTAYQPIAPFLYPFLAQQSRSASILSSLSENPGHYNKKIRRGRGPASGKGKTSGRGTKGQKAHGKVPFGFNGGQTKDEVVAGKRGFDNPFSVEMSPVNLDRIQAWIDKGRLDASKPITMKELNRSRCLHGVKDGVKLLARGKEELRSKINIIVSRASAEAIAAVESQGGTVTTRFYSEFAVRKVLRGEMDPIHSHQSQIQVEAEGSEAPQEKTTQYRYRLPDPVGRKDLEYYRDAAKRGYLSHTVKEGHGPSLFFKDPTLAPKPRTDGAKKRKVTGEVKVAKKTDARLW
ncbi:hypothetical protein AMS68_000814 [Peltaster fructicola]|uniref:Large ribosomal subunit protein uL15/eL18 domain-containing protein n=1 Tax=Peltaster fructicola TaxID=286661 RepID=A0A6H0XKM7_9PEZI|nr:hypothetical protein AMS68_000814 [Peltaster fructicola]